MYDIQDLYDYINTGASIEKVHKRFGGTRIYISQQIKDFEIKVRDDFNGKNYHKLADKYNVSLSTIYKIVKK